MQFRGASPLNSSAIKVGKRKRERERGEGGHETLRLFSLSDLYMNPLCLSGNRRTKKHSRLNILHIYPLNVKMNKSPQYLRLHFTHVPLSGAYLRIYFPKKDDFFYNLFFGEGSNEKGKSLRRKWGGIIDVMSRLLRLRSWQGEVSGTGGGSAIGVVAARLR